MNNALRFGLNDTMRATKEIKNSGWKQIAICYGIYVLIAIAAQTLLQSRGISVVLLAYTVAAFACVGYIGTIGKRTWPSLGMRGDLPKEYAFGWLLAAVLLLALWAINLIAGAITFTMNPNFSIAVFLLLLVGFIFQGFMEEFLFRALIFTQVALKRGVVAGVIINSAIFSFGHLGNANASAVSVANTFLLGVLFSVIYYYHDNIWVVAAFHSGWNFILGPVLGIEVSGFELPTTLLTSVSDKNWTALNGGAYGLEAGYPVTVSMIVCIGIYVFLIKRKADRAGIVD